MFAVYIAAMFSMSSIMIDADKAHDHHDRSHNLQSYPEFHQA